MKNLFLWAVLPLMFIGFVGCEKDIDPNLDGADELHYTTSDEKTIAVDPEDFDAQIVSHPYENGSGVIKFSKPISKIGEQAFSEKLKLKTIHIPNKVSVIAFQAFYYCDNLEFVTFGNSVKTIEQGAFANCKKLASVLLPNIETIETSAFSSCRALNEVTLSGSIKTIGEYAFSSCDVLRIYCKATTPPSLDSDSFWKTDVTVYVPNASLWKYETDSSWSKYDLVGYDF